jgi:hypothetical protein
MAEDEESARPSRLAWGTEDGVANCDLSGHFWAIVQPAEQDGRVVWSWMIIGYENQVLASGQTGDLGAAKLLVEEWDRWVAGPDAVLDSSDNPMPVAGDDKCMIYQPIWPRWPWPISGEKP